MLPKHKNPTDPKRTAVAPYNFIPLPDRPFAPVDSGEGALNPDQRVYDTERRLTGWIEVVLQTRSPMYIRGPLKPDEHLRRQREDNDPEDRTPHLEKMRNKPDFFYTGDPKLPVIPGSTLRGMIRNVVEILGHGKFGPLPDRALIYRAVADTSSHVEAYCRQLMAEVPNKMNWFNPKQQAGFIREEPDGWYIQPAPEVNGTTHTRLSHRKIRECGRLQRLPGTRNAYDIHVKVGENEFQKVRGRSIQIRRVKVIEASATPRNGLVPAVVAESGAIPGKATEAIIFKPDLGAGVDDTWIRIPDGNDPEDRRDLITQYLDQLTPTQIDLLGPKGVLRNGQPVFYLMENDRLIFFGHTQMFRLPYKRSPEAFLPINYTDEGRIDLAEAMFGKVRGNQGGQAGRVFVSDAQLDPDQDAPWLSGGVVIPKVLSTPKPTTFQHYLTQSQPDIPQGKGLHTYNDEPGVTTLRGYKRYWPKGDISRESFAEKQENIRDPKKDSQHTRIKPIRSGLTFRFRVRFENLLLQELGLLWWALDLPADDGADYCHQVGMGKPLGLGVVKLTPKLHLFHLPRRYSQLFTDSGDWEGGTTSPDETDKTLRAAIEQFEQFIAKSQGEAGKPFAQLQRVRMLLTMMQWRQETPSWLEATRYMEIERRTPDGRKENEYRYRPVLPDPLHVK